jgi:uncharacterized protein YqeY
LNASPPDGADALRAALRGGLVDAMRARDADASAALRTAIAALDNAQAVAAPDAARLRRQSALLSAYLRRSGDVPPPGAGAQ